MNVFANRVSSRFGDIRIESYPGMLFFGTLFILFMVAFYTFFIAAVLNGSFNYVYIVGTEMLLHAVGLYVVYRSLSNTSHPMHGGKLLMIFSVCMGILLVFNSIFIGFYLLNKNFLENMIYINSALAVFGYSIDSYRHWSISSRDLLLSKFLNLCFFLIFINPVCCLELCHNIVEYYNYCAVGIHYALVTAFYYAVKIAID